MCVQNDHIFYEYILCSIETVRKQKFVDDRIYCVFHHKNILFYQDNKQRECAVRILTYIDGKMYAKTNINNDIEKSLGKLLALQSKHLNNFMHIQAMRKFEWDPSNISWVKKYINLFSGLKKNVIFEAIKQHVKFVKKNKNNLKHSVTHGDPNDYNIVVKNQKIVGLIDFGDSIYAPSINDLAISLSYALTQSQNLFATLQNIIGSYRSSKCTVIC